MGSDSEHGEPEKQWKGHSWIVDDVVAHVENGVVTLQIGRPSPGRHLPRKASTAPNAQAVAAKDWYTAQMERLARSRAGRETATIPLTDRRLRSSLRLGGGFLITQGRYLVLFRRDEAAPNRAALFCECAGAYEVLSAETKGIENDYVASLLKESAELAIVRTGPDERVRIMIPVLAPGPDLPAYAPRPDVGLDEYNKVVERELLSEAWAAKLPVMESYCEGHDLKEAVESKRPGEHLDPCETTKLANLMSKDGYLIRFQVRILTYDTSVRLQFDYSPEISVEMTAEADSSSLECVGVLGYPEDLERAALAFVGEKAQEQFRGREREEEVDKALGQVLQYIKREIADLALWNNPAASLVFNELSKLVVDEIRKVNELRKLNLDDAKAKETIEAERDKANKEWEESRKDAEARYKAAAAERDAIFRRPPRSEESRGFCGQAGKETLCQNRFLGYEYWDTELDRGEAIHRYIYVISTEDGSGWVWKTDGVNRRGTPTDLWEALSESRLTRSQGRVATEKLEKAIRMHCPNTALIPLSTL